MPLRSPIVCSALATALAVVTACTTKPSSDLGSPSLPSSTASPTPPCSDGFERECHLTISKHAGVVVCLTGSQTCAAGAWSACGGSSRSLAVRPDLSSSTGAASGDVTTQSVSASAACTDNPCDPSCQRFDEDAGKITPPVSASGGTSWSGINFNGAVPGGFLNKGLKDRAHSYGDSCQSYAGGSYSACQFDFFCDSASGNCKQYQPSQRIPVGVCPGIDLTAGVTCDHSSGVPQVPICNRGNTKVDAGKTIRSTLYNANSVDFPGSPPCAVTKGSVSGTCALTLTKDLLPGECVDMPESKCTNKFTGNNTIYVNSDQAIPECGLPATPGCSDNWTDYHSGAATCEVVTAKTYDPLVYTQRYEGKCPSGTRALWTVLTYETQAPSNASGPSNVKFEVHTAPLELDGGAGTFGAFATAASTPGAGDPAVCPMAGVAGCPKDLFTVLGGAPAATNPLLELKVTLDPTPDKLLVPTLVSWKVSYSCPASE
jgi:hypothetical protein